MSNEDLLTLKVKSLPLTPGCYLFKDKDGTVIYVGKAVSLRTRVQSYFRTKKDRFKTELLVTHIVDLDVIETSSEAEALLLEASLVKTYNPKYNIELKDGKTYPYIQITKEDFPLISVTRLNTRKGTVDVKKVELFGPYTNVTLIKEALIIIRKIFTFRSCQPLPDKDCLDFHIGLCQAPCVGRISRREYKRNVAHVRLILEGKKDLLYKQLTERMEKLSQAKKFEEAAKVRDQIRAIGALYSSTKDLNFFKEGEQLQRILNLPKRPERIECFDISNTYGEQKVGSMVSFFNGRPDKSNYRKFKIKEVGGIDDFQCMAEVIRRRYSRLQREGKAYPDLIMVDGGKGQLSAAQEELKKLNLSLPLISLAKQLEEVFVPGKRASIVLPRNSLALQLLQRLRDEAHRFAITFHRSLRAKKMYE